MLTWFSGKKKSTSSALSKGKDDFVSLSSHELRSPLSIIKWYTEILLDGDAGILTEDQRKYLTLIELSNQRAIDLVRSLLNVSRLDLGTFSVSPEEVSLVALLSEATTSLQSEISKKKIQVIVDNEDKIKNIQADKHLCLIVLKNLLSNAVFFSKEEGEVHVSLEFAAKKLEIAEMRIPEDSILLRVTDNGIGIPEADQSKISSKMFRASNVKDSDGTGSGLGLYITKSIIEYVGGKFWFTSQEGKCSTFYVTFPTRGMDKKEGKTTLD